MDIKDTMRKELAIILQIDNKADYNNKKYVRSVRNYIEEKNINGSAYGQRFEKQIKSIDENDNFRTENMSCVVCNKESSPKLICQACRDKLIGTSVRKQEEINKSQSSVNASETVSGIINEETKQTIKNTANAVSSSTKKTVDTITERVNVILGGEGKVDLRLRDLFSQVLKKHTKEEADELFICGTKYTTPAPDKISTAWPKPWFIFPSRCSINCYFFYSVTMLQESG